MRDLILEKRKLFKKSINLNNLSKEDSKNSFEIKQMQNEVYKKYKFYDEFLKTQNKRK